MKNKKFSFKTEYVEVWNYVKSLKNYIYLSLGIFVLFALIGFFVPAPEFLRQIILNFLKELVDKTSGLSQVELIAFLFFNNTTSSFFGMFFGIFLGIFPLISLIFNGYLLGFVASISVSEAGPLILWRLFPHGIFELPALFLSLSMGLKLATFVLKKNVWKELKNYSLNSMRVFILVVIPLLIIAAIIEGSLIVLA